MKITLCYRFVSQASTRPALQAVGPKDSATPSRRSHERRGPVRLKQQGRRSVLSLSRHVGHAGIQGHPPGVRSCARGNRLHPVWGPVPSGHHSTHVSCSLSWPQLLPAPKRVVALYLLENICHLYCGHRGFCAFVARFGPGSLNCLFQAVCREHAEAYRDSRRKGRLCHPLSRPLTQYSQNEAWNRESPLPGQ